LYGLHASELDEQRKPKLKQITPMKNRPKSKILIAGAFAIAGLLQPRPAAAEPLDHVGKVFYIYMENHNWVQPNGNVDNSPTSGIEQVKGNPAAPFINRLIDPADPLSGDVSYTNNCYNVLATPTGANPSIHPSEPNYIWQEGGSNFGVTNDSDPYKDTTDAAGNVASFRTSAFHGTRTRRTLILNPRPARSTSRPQTA
jgi:hypothetical protein